jgi:hypothetical protein
MERLPDCQQHPITVFSPLIIPKSQLLNVLGCEPPFPFLVAFFLFGQAVLKAI